MRPNTERKSRATLTAAAAALVALIVLAGACSSPSSNRTVASLPGQTGSGGGTSGQPLTPAQGDQEFIDFARCMRAHGVATPDPVHIPGHQGLSLSLPDRNATTTPAYSACEHLLAGVEQMKRQGAVQELPALTAYAHCMRAHDISMLDPTPAGQLSLGNVPGITSDFGRYSPQFRAADTACRQLLPAGVHDDGSGP